MLFGNQLERGAGQQDNVIHFGLMALLNCVPGKLLLTMVNFGYAGREDFPRPPCPESAVPVRLEHPRKRPFARL
jgi:hypothetical protein